MRKQCAARRKVVNFQNHLSPIRQLLLRLPPFAGGDDDQLQSNTIFLKNHHTAVSAVKSIYMCISSYDVRVEEKLTRATCFLDLLTNNVHGDTLRPVL